MNLVRRIALALMAMALVAFTAVPALAKLDEKDWSKAKKDLEAGLASNDASQIAGAVDVIGQDQSKRAVELLVNIGAKLDDITVYEAVKKALAGMTDDEAVGAMVSSLSSKSGPEQWTTRCVLVECMSSVKGDNVTQAIVKALDDKVPYVTSAAAKSLGKRRDKGAVAALIKKLGVLEKSKDVVWVDVKQALTDITGQDLADAKEWDDFWKVRGEGFDVEKDRGDKNDSTTTLRPGEESGSFFSEPIVAKRIMFVIDVSGSMREKDIPIEGKGTQTRIQVVKDELVRCIKGLKKDVRFNVIAYDDKLKFWKPIEKGGAALLPANEGNKQDAMKWAAGLKENGMTHTDDALKKAFETLEVNQIILLSDGAPAKVVNNQQVAVDTNEILKMVAGLNRLRGVKINTFCFAVFERMGAGELLKFMEDLAKQNGGKLSLVGGGGLPKPPPGGGGAPPGGGNP